MGNSRGSKFSLEHKEFSNQSAEFWQYNLHELGVYDLRAMMDYIFSSPSIESSKLYYIGHSQGCTMLLILLSMFPEYNGFIKQAHLLTPAIILKNSKSLLLTISANHERPLKVRTNLDLESYD